MMHESDEVEAAVSPPEPTPAPPPWAMATFAILFAMNLLDYIDRNVLTSMKPQIAPDLGISNERWGLLASIFLVSYSVFSPMMGWLRDRYRRTWLLGLAVGDWSLATIGSGQPES